jgi:S1-C subfamily serine protease
VLPAVVAIQAEEQRTGNPSVVSRAGVLIRPGERASAAARAGVLIRPDGHVLTDLAGVGTADTVEVTLHNGRTLKGRVFGRDSVTGVALLKIDARDRPFLRLRDTPPEAGETLLAVGHPDGLLHSVAVGIVSGVGRRVEGLEGELIQASLDLPAGYLGGPLLDTAGHLMGLVVRTSKKETPDVPPWEEQVFRLSSPHLSLPPSGEQVAAPAQSPRATLAQPASDLAPIIRQLTLYGEVSRPWLGVGSRAISPEEARAARIDQGAVIQQVVDRSPAAQARLREQDVIIRFGGSSIGRPDDLIRAILERKVGEEVEVAFVRGRQPRKVTLKLGRRPPEGTL